MMQSIDPDDIEQYWRETIDQMNDQFASTIEQNVEAQTKFMEAWLAAIDDATAETDIEEALDGYRRAYEIWMSAAEESLESVSNASTGEDVSVTQFRDTWLNAANESFKELMGTGAFAAATGRAVEELMDVRTQTDELTEDALHEFGMPAKGDIQAIGDRLVELERRQHDVESKLDRILDQLEDG